MSPARSAARRRPAKKPPKAQRPAWSYKVALKLSQDLAGALRDAGVVEGRRGQAIVFAGSLRRKADAVRDLDVLLVGRTDQEWAALGEVAGLTLTAWGPKKAHGTFTVGRGIQLKIPVDIRRVERRSLGAALEYFTGPKGHNIGMRAKAKQRGWRLNEYGLFGARGVRLAGHTEQDIYDALGHPWKPPELRGR